MRDVIQVERAGAAGRRVRAASPELGRVADELLPPLVARLGVSDLGEIEVRQGTWRVRIRRRRVGVRPRRRIGHAATGRAGRHGSHGQRHRPTPAAAIAAGPPAPTRPAGRPSRPRSATSRSSRASRWVTGCPAGDVLGWVDVLGVRTGDRVARRRRHRSLRDRAGGPRGVRPGAGGAHRRRRAVPWIRPAMPRTRRRHPARPVPPDVRPHPHRQPGRDRAAGPARLPADGHLGRGRLQRGRPRLARRAARRRGHLRRPRRVASQLPVRGIDPVRGRGHRLRGHPPRLRLPVRGRRLRGDDPRPRPDLHRAAARGAGAVRVQGGHPGAAGGPRAADHPRLGGHAARRRPRPRGGRSASATRC